MCCAFRGFLTSFHCNFTSNNESRFTIVGWIEFLGWGLRVSKHDSKDIDCFHKKSRWMTWPQIELIAKKGRCCSGEHDLGVISWHKISCYIAQFQLICWLIPWHSCGESLSRTSCAQGVLSTNAEIKSLTLSLGLPTSKYSCMVGMSLLPTKIIGKCQNPVGMLGTIPVTV